MSRGSTQGSAPANAVERRATALAVEGLVAGYGATPVIHDVTLEVSRGEIVALVGRNGAGKSTALRAIAGLISSKGQVRVCDREVKGHASSRCRTALGLVLEGRSVFGELTVEQNFLAAAVDPTDGYEMFPELRRRRTAKAGSLSGGEQQMLAVARALIRRPEVLLIDELSFGLAPIICTRILSTLRDIATDLGLGVLIVEQQLPYAIEYSSRVYVLRDGHIALQLPSAELEARRLEIEGAYLGI